MIQTKPLHDASPINLSAWPHDAKLMGIGEDQDGHTVYIDLANGKHYSLYARGTIAPVEIQGTHA